MGHGSGIFVGRRGVAGCGALRGSAADAWESASMALPQGSTVRFIPEEETGSAAPRHLAARGRGWQTGLARR
ncbi:hypothetical protein FRAAL3386 [Frankia alni ACN14a]|uniref:Uncharacterized protein n=1 Tax=Frankia alni (strain DSM 45986 / CECT 9034 / ACN14a) TaxID=326424 RepID=Q0RKC8_FRAAA|nr:hypothetical protein FRAAL3386 [Frankia alni ACN14a]